MITEELRAVVADVGDVAEAQDARVLLVGAYARDLCLGPNKATRGTRDVDFAIRLGDWSEVDRYFDRCRDRFSGVRPAELTMIHTATGISVDVVPCGGIEQPPGRLSLRRSTRTLNVKGLAECFAAGRPMTEAHPNVTVPSPYGYLLIKLLAFVDRRAPRDLRDLGFVLEQLPVSEDDVWADEALVELFGTGEAMYEDARYWLAGRRLSREFGEGSRAAFLEALNAVTAMTAATRVGVVQGGLGVDPDRRLERADRILRMVGLGVRGG